MGNDQKCNINNHARCHQIASITVRNIKIMIFQHLTKQNFNLIMR